MQTSNISKRQVIILLLSTFFLLGGCGFFSGSGSDFDTASQYDLDGVDSMRIEVEQGELFVLDIRQPDTGMGTIKGAVFDPVLLRLEKYVEDREPGEVPRVRYLFTPLAPCATSIIIKLHGNTSEGHPSVYKQIDVMVAAD
jgi:hypothetical protein